MIKPETTAANREKAALYAMPVFRLVSWGSSPAIEGYQVFLVK